MTKLLKLTMTLPEGQSGRTVSYTPGKSAVENGAVRANYVVTPEGIEVPDDVALFAVADNPDMMVASAAPESAAQPAEKCEGAVATVDVESPGDIASLGIHELVAVARQRKLKGRSGMNKAALIAALS